MLETNLYIVRQTCRYSQFVQNSTACRLGMVRPLEVAAVRNLEPLERVAVLADAKRT